MAETHGEWWRPDLEEYRLRFRAASARGLKTVTLYNGLQVFRRWQPRGTKTFEQELVLPQAQQHAFYLVVEDRDGKRAISMSFWLRNLMMYGYLLTDRCNFLGDARLRTKDGMEWWVPVGFRNHAGIPANKGLIEQEIEPAVWLSAPAPTLPIDGAPGGFPTQRLIFNPSVPGELRYIFSSPSFYLVGREVAVGQSDYRLGYDPAEVGAKATPLGHLYEQPQQGTGNAWSSWHRLIPTRKVDGFVRTYACNYRPPDAFRIGWHETSLTVKDPITLEKDGMQVMYVSGRNWRIYRDGKPIATPGMDNAVGAFTRGTVAVLPDSGGAIVVMPMDGPLRFRYFRDGFFSVFYAPEGKSVLTKGEALHYTVAFAGGSGRKTTEEMLAFATQFGVMQPGVAAYAPMVTRGNTLDTFLVWSVQAADGAVEATLPKVPLSAFLPAQITGLHDNWSVYLLDRQRAGVNFRALPMRDGVAYAQLDTTEADADLFLGHPVVSSRPEMTLQVSWQEPKVWYVEAHNPGAKTLAARIHTNSGWTRFRLDTTITLRPGESRVWRIAESSL
jgi:hypothetical protein